MARFTTRADRGDGLDLRTIRYGDQEVVSRIYFAVRDRFWRTVPLTVHSGSRTQTPGGFRFEATASTLWPSHPLDVRLRYTAEGDELDAEFEATARDGFDYARIGFCVLFPAAGYQGRAATSWLGGAPTTFVFPERVVTRDHTDAPARRFHRRFDRLDASLSGGTRVAFGFLGEAFEFEDQRNWTDASYKAYSSPPGRLHADPGDRFAQRIRIRAVAPLLGAAAPPGLAVRLGAPIGVLPPVTLYDGRLSPRSFRPAGGFHELNATPPALAGCDSVELPLNGAVHAADDDSVLEATATHGDLVAQARATGLPVRLAPVSFLDVAGDWRDETGAYAPEPPPGPLPARLLGPLAATWVLASVARAVPAGADALAYLDVRLPADAPAARAVARLAALAGAAVLAVSAPPPLAALAVRDAGGVTVAVANTGPDPVAFTLPGGRTARLAGFASEWFALSAPDRQRPGAVNAS
ncbi:hypothetical protein Ais01nite_15300 [Asanoa ishikariensis]|uniref:Uncharacterized protein n=1 Tax=Asanoa ishikariensis TaxID=137265 RepID=A0A1H3UHQ0_9ACTN|nr:hypothetical protein [Asanoa ishikariensis]GIF63495.1 hypothetical protein Ais01nite_15300 [Asanoa ishikariensis]SDZ61938.1 hypothetical protein SAMN05421684_7343 [Asanoa ishikariensis]